MNYRKTKSGYVVILDKGESVIETLTAFCVNQKINNAHFSTIGAVDYASCGYYDLTEKKYYFKQYNEPLEVVSSTGNVMLKNNEPFIHLHTVFTDTENKAFGGHVEEMRVGVTLEIMLTTLETELSREHNEEIGLFLISCGE